MEKSKIQGVINATLGRLDLHSKDKLAKYGQTLTQEQKRQGRSHLETTREIRSLIQERK